MTEPLPSGDELVILRAGPSLQSEIDSLPSKLPGVKALVIECPHFYDERVKPTLAISLPHLETLKLIDVAFENIVLNTRLTPKIQELYMENISDDCDLTIVLPDLTLFTMHYYEPTFYQGWIDVMLENAKQLQKFDSYMFCVNVPLYFASNHLELIRLHGAEYPERLTLYAPRLKYLSLEACFNRHQLDAELIILDSHPAFVPPLTMTRFEVNTVGANLSPEMLCVLENNPRVIWEGEDDLDDAVVN